MAASEILGLFTTPEQYQQNQLAQARSRAFQEVQLDPFQQAALGARTAGYQFGQAVGGALGGQDPQLQLIARTQQLLGQLDRSDPMSYRRVAKMASDAGDQQLAQGIAEAGMKAETEMNRAAQLGAEKMTSEQRNALAYADFVAPRNTIEHNEAFQSRFDQLTLKAGQANKPFEFEVKEAKIQDLKANLRVLESQPTQNQEAIQRLKDSIQSIEGVTPEQKADIPKIGISEATGEAVYYDRNADLQFIKKRDPKDPTKQIRVPFEGRIDQTTSSVTATASSKQAAGINQNKLDLAKSVEESAFSASDRISLAQSLRELAPKAFTGFAADAKLSASKVASAFGIPTKGGTESEIIDQILGQMTIGSAGQLKGALSDKDVLFLKKTIGTRGLSVNTLLFVADEIERLAAQDRNLNTRINKVTQSGGNLNEVNFEEEKTKSSTFVKSQISEYRNIMKKVGSNTATLEEAKKAKQIRDELGL